MLFSISSISFLILRHFGEQDAGLKPGDAASENEIYVTLNQAVTEAVAPLNPGLAVLHIGPGVYREKLVISRPNLTFQGEGNDREDTVLCWGDAALVTIYCGYL